MSEKTSIFSAENLQTIVAVAFVLALMSLAVNFYTLQQVGVAAGGLAEFDLAQLEQARTADKALGDRLDALEAELTSVKSELAAQKAAATLQAAAAPADEAEAATP